MKAENLIRVGSELEGRTLRFAVTMLRFAETLPSQMLRSATAVGANYREANRAESKADFVHKVALALKEVAETEYWLQLCVATGLGVPDSAERLRKEASELIVILTTIRHKAAK